MICFKIKRDGHHEGTSTTMVEDEEMESLPLIPAESGKSTTKVSKVRKKRIVGPKRINLRSVKTVCCRTEITLTKLMLKITPPMPMLL